MANINIKTIVIVAVALLFLGEMLLTLFVNAPASQPVQDEGIEFLSAIMKARALGLQGMVVKDADLAESLKEKGCSVLKIGSEYSVKCEEGDFLKGVDAQFKVSLAVENVTTIRGTLPTYREVTINVPFYIPVNSTIELKGTAYIKNGTIIDITPSELYRRNATIVENATVVEVINTTYSYEVPFDLRSLFKEYGDVKNLVYTNNTLSKAPFVEFVGSGYIIVNDTVNSTDVLAAYPDAYFPVQVMEFPQPLPVDVPYNITTWAVVETSLGNITLKLFGKYEEGDTIPLKVDAEVSGDLPLSYSVGLVEQQPS